MRFFFWQNWRTVFLSRNYFLSDELRQYWLCKTGSGMLPSPQVTLSRLSLLVSWPPTDPSKAVHELPWWWQNLFQREPKAPGRRRYWLQSLWLWKVALIYDVSGVHLANLLVGYDWRHEKSFSREHCKVLDCVLPLETSVLLVCGYYVSFVPFKILTRAIQT